jgi:hypothetical protein
LVSPWLGGVAAIATNQLSDDATLETLWERRQAAATGQRRYRRAS